MKRIALLAAALSAPAAFAQPFAIDWNTIQPGGNVSGGDFQLFGVISQYDAGAELSGGTFAFNGGYIIPGRQCPADVDNGTASGTPDGGVTIEDLLYYLVVFAQGTTAADLDNGSGAGVPDGGVTIEDLLFFLARFAAGC